MMSYILYAALVLGVIWFISVNRWRFQLGCWAFNEKVDETLDLMLRRAISSGIQSVSAKDEFRITVEFRNDEVLCAWNANRYYSWLHRGSLGDYSWNDARPTVETMVKLRDAIRDYYLK